MNENVKVDPELCNLLFSTIMTGICERWLSAPQDDIKNILERISKCFEKILEETIQFDSAVIGSLLNVCLKIFMLSNFTKKNDVAQYFLKLEPNSIGYCAINANQQNLGKIDPSESHYILIASGLKFSFRLGQIFCRLW